MTIRILVGDMRERLRELDDASIDSVCTDPPYHLTSIVKRFGSKTAAPAKSGKTGAYARASRGFMGQTWDGGDVAFQPETWAEVFRVMKPGAHLLAFSAPRCFGRMQVAIEDAGFEVRDSIIDLVASDNAARLFMASLAPAQVDAFLRCIEDSQFGGLLAWIYGSGFPKSHDVSKAIDRYNGDSREKIAVDGNAPAYQRKAGNHRPWMDDAAHLIDGSSAASAAWQGWGTALKPAIEPIVVARKPLAGTVAANVLAYGTGALNIDGCRVAIQEKLPRYSAPGSGKTGTHIYSGGWRGEGKNLADPHADSARHDARGRWPSNVAHDGSDDVIAAFPQTTTGNLNCAGGSKDGWGMGARDGIGHIGSTGSAARFFYSAKTDQAERHAGCEHLDKGNRHPTVKPVDLMRWLCRLVTPPGGTVLDPFCGSGSTLIAADAEQFDAIGIEMDPDYVEIAKARLAHAGGLFAEISIEPPAEQAA